MTSVSGVYNKDVIQFLHLFRKDIYCPKKTMSTNYEKNKKFIELIIQLLLPTAFNESYIELTSIQKRNIAATWR